ncbi:SH3 domain-containing protein [Hymenobacter tibetensis]|uniref:SH3 domain-containing protein n=1 Tax=Hymenobacter tibetensis TaxID=497967 RepID=A0ABY4CWC7_9BACT|nr:SH3 domain-containing protein [Hymenobacter tibetensis]UOG74568.1 SH3 domain-containing protein [Hymenobacter tibetensis]
MLFFLSLVASAQVRDSARVDQTDTQEQLLSYRYVNASSLTLRALPSAAAQALARLDGASRLLLVEERADGWSQVQVQDYLGYVKSEYLVEEQDQVTAETVDWEIVEVAGGQAYTKVSTVESPRVVAGHPATRPVSSKHSRGPKAYICNNGRTEVYHNSEDCSAMRRCTYQTKIATTSEARNSGLRECMKCF